MRASHAIRKATNIQSTCNVIQPYLSLLTLSVSIVYLHEKMAKQRKTLEEKIKTQQRHQHSAPLYSLASIQTASNSTKPFLSSSVTTYGYVTKDIQKTFLISLFLVVVEVLLFLLLKQHMVKFPFVTY